MPEGQHIIGYVAAKRGGMIAMTRELAAQWARRGIRVNAISLRVSSNAYDREGS